MINPGTEPVDGREDVAAANLAVFLDTVAARTAEMAEVTIRRRVAALTGEQRRDPSADRDGRFGWDLPFDDGRVARLLMPGVEVGRLRDDVTARAPCLYVNGSAAWWNAAVDLIAGEGMTLA